MKRLFSIIVFWGILSQGLCQSASNIVATTSEDDTSEDYYYGVALPFTPEKYKQPLDCDLPVGQFS